MRRGLMSGSEPQGWRKLTIFFFHVIGVRVVYLLKSAVSVKEAWTKTERLTS